MGRWVQGGLHRLDVSRGIQMRLTQFQFWSSFFHFLTLVTIVLNLSYPEAIHLIFPHSW